MASAVFAETAGNYQHPTRLKNESRSYILNCCREKRRTKNCKRLPRTTATGTRGLALTSSFVNWRQPGDLEESSV
jgi:hypothetical protein